MDLAGLTMEKKTGHGWTWPLIPDCPIVGLVDTETEVMFATLKGTRAKRTRLWVVDHFTQDVDMMLGNDLLAALHVSLVFTHGRAPVVLPF